MICKVCNGTGLLRTSSNVCTKCGGTGEVRSTMQDVPELREMSTWESKRYQNRKRGW